MVRPLAPCYPGAMAGRAWWLCCIVLLGCLVTVAHAQQLGAGGDPPEAAAAQPVGVRLLVGGGYGTQNDSDAGSYGTALGLDVSYTSMRWLHLGLHGTFHVGTRFEDRQNRVVLLGTEAGARIGGELIALVPYLIVGLASVQSERNTEPWLLRSYFGTGFSLELEPWHPVVVALDARFAYIPLGSSQFDTEGPDGTFDILLTAGAHL